MKTAMNNVLLPTLFNVVNNIAQYCHRSGIEPDVSLSKIYVRDFEELASAFVRFARVRFARVRSLASDLLASDLLASDRSRQICLRGVNLSC